MTRIDFRCISVDGYGDRDDMALAQDREWNNRRPEKDWRDTVNYEWAQSPEEGEHIERAVQRMIEQDNMITYHQKENLYFPALNDWGEPYTLSDALNEVCILLGLSDEDFAPSLLIEGSSVEIRLQ